MDRRSILQSALAALALQNVSSSVNAQTSTGTPCLLSGKETKGTLAIFGGESKPAGGAVSLHIHHDQDEWWYIIEGQHLFQIGDRKIVAKPGDALYGPRGVPHSHRRLTTGAGIGGYLGAGTIEEFFIKVAQRRQKDPKAALDDLFLAHGMKIVGPPVEP
jgi:uncharacterized cupin superfamily protein